MYLPLFPPHPRHTRPGTPPRATPAWWGGRPHPGELSPTAGKPLGAALSQVPRCARAGADPDEVRREGPGGPGLGLSNLGPLAAADPASSGLWAGGARARGVSGQDLIKQPGTRGTP